jgi:hypothetical protein
MAFSIHSHLMTFWSRIVIGQFNVTPGELARLGVWWPLTPLISTVSEAFACKAGHSLFDNGILTTAGVRGSGR